MLLKTVFVDIPHKTVLIDCEVLVSPLQDNLKLVLQDLVLNTIFLVLLVDPFDFCAPVVRNLRLFLELLSGFTLAVEKHVSVR